MELKDWLLDLGDFITNKNSTKFDKLVQLQFDMFRHTGWFNENQYFSKSEVEDLKTKFPLLITTLAGLDGILSSYKYLKAEDNFLDSSFKNMLDILKVLVKHRIELPDLLLFEQFSIEKEGILGNPIKLDKQLLKKSVL